MKLNGRVFSREDLEHALNIFSPMQMTKKGDFSEMQRSGSIDCGQFRSLKGLCISMVSSFAFYLPQHASQRFPI